MHKQALQYSCSLAQATVIINNDCHRLGGANREAFHYLDNHERPN